MTAGKEVYVGEDGNKDPNVDETRGYIWCFIRGWVGDPWRNADLVLLLYHHKDVLKSLLILGSTMRKRVRQQEDQGALISN